MAGGFEGFVILADMRTGSNALEERLNAYEGIVSHGEVFNPLFLGKPDTTTLMGLTIGERDDDPAEMIRRLRAKSRGLAGFRLFSDHDPRALDLSLSDRATAKIILTRNALDSYISLKIARATGQWWLSDVKARKSARATFDAAEFEAFASARAAHLRAIRHRLKSTGQTAFEIAYEDLGDDAVIAGCARFLGARHLRARAGKRGRVQNPVPLSERVANVAEMKAALAARDPFDTDHHPDFEPARGPNVPSFVACRTAPLLYMPVKCAADTAVLSWMVAVDGTTPDGLETGFSQKALRAWKRGQGAHRGFTVVDHPVPRAHAAFSRFILPTGPGAFTRIRRILRRSYHVPLPDDPDDPGFDASARHAAFLAFLKFLRPNLSGQTAVRVDSAWASQSALIRGMADFALPDRICRAHTLDRDLSELTHALRIDAPAPAPPDHDPALSEIYDDRIERAARSAYQRDYMMFGFGPWRLP